MARPSCSHQTTATIPHLARELFTMKAMRRPDENDADEYVLQCGQDVQLRSRLLRRRYRLDMVSTLR